MEFIVYILLILTSTVGLAFIIERGFALRWAKVLPPPVEAAVQSCQRHEDVPMLKRVCQQHNSPMARLLRVAIDHLDWTKTESTEALQPAPGTSWSGSNAAWSCWKSLLALPHCWAWSGR